MELHSTISLMACQPQDVVTKNHIKYNSSYTLKAKKRNLNLLRFFLSGTMFLGRDKETEKEGFEPSRRVNDLHP